MTIKKRIHSLKTNLRKKGCNTDNYVFKMKKLADEINRNTKKAITDNNRELHYTSGDMRIILTTIRTKINNEIKKQNWESPRTVNKIINAISYDNLIDKSKEFKIISDKEFKEISDYHCKIASEIIDLIPTDTLLYQLVEIYFQMSFLGYTVYIIEVMRGLWD